LAFNDRHHLVAPVALFPRERQELDDSNKYGTLLRRAHDTHATTSREVKQSFVA
jgi:hypothetical protein